MKGFIAASLALVPEFLAMPRKKPIHLAFSYNEAVGCVGAPVMLAALRDRAIRPDGCVVGAPTCLQVVVAPKGLTPFLCCVQSRTGHSSLPLPGGTTIE